MSIQLLFGVVTRPLLHNEIRIRMSIELLRLYQRAVMLRSWPWRRTARLRCSFGVEAFLAETDERVLGGMVVKERWFSTTHD